VQMTSHANVALKLDPRMNPPCGQATCSADVVSCSFLKVMHTKIDRTGHGMTTKIQREQCRNNAGTKSSFKQGTSCRFP